MKFFSDLNYYLREGWANFSRSRLLSVFSILIIAVSIAIITVFSTLFFNVDQYLKKLENNPVYSIFLSSDASEKEAKDLAKYLETLKGVSDVVYVAPDDGMKKLADHFPLAAEIQKTIQENPLPRSIRARIETRAIADVQKAIHGYSFVDSVYSPNYFLEQLKSISAAVSFFIALISAILILASVFTIYNVIRITILARQIDIDIMQLVGADMKYIRVPFTVEGVLQGVSGGILGSLIGYAMVLIIRSHYLSKFNYLPFLSQINTLPLSYFSGIFLLSIVFGLLGSTVAASRIDYV